MRANVFGLAAIFILLFGAGCSNIAEPGPSARASANSGELAFNNQCQDPETGRSVDCAADEVCRFGQCVPADSCRNNSECADNQFCNGDPANGPVNTCVDLECEVCQDAQNHICIDVPAPQCCTEDAQCGGDQQCAGNTCVDLICDDDPEDCFDVIAQDNQCIFVEQANCCLNDGDCQDADSQGPFCNMDTNLCVQCTENGQCGADQRCTEDNLCEDVVCEPRIDACTTQQINPQTRVCEEDRTPAPECCLEDNECGEGFCVENSCQQCRNNGDCGADQTCNAGVCEDIVCVPVNDCADAVIVDQRCTQQPIMGCCLDDAACGGNGVCEDNVCVECRQDNDCPLGEVCNEDVNLCAEAECPAQEGCTAFVFNNDTRQCEPSVVEGCCLNAADDASCRSRRCINDGDCNGNEQCSPLEGGLFCVPRGLPDGYTVGCETDAVADQANACTTCRALDDDNGNTVCAAFEVCGNGFDDNGNGDTDEGVPTPDGLMPDPAVHCVGCNVNADCLNGLVCNPDTFVCEVEPECRGDVDCGQGNECVAGSCQPIIPVDPCDGVECAEGQLCDAGNCIADPSLCENGGNVCPQGLFCNGANQCVVQDPCEGVVCADGQVCDAGNCIADPTLCENGGNICPQGQVCQNAQCVVPDPCDGVECAEGQLCVNGACEPIGEQQFCAARFLNSPCGASCSGEDGGVVCLWEPSDLPGRETPQGCLADGDNDGVSAAEGDCDDGNPEVQYCWGEQPPQCADVGITPVDGPIPQQ